jgi:FlaA1/EpsC-like NDP-sugar epimerase
MTHIAYDGIGRELYWIVLFALVKLVFLLIIVFTWKVYIIAWSDMRKNSILRVFLEKFIYPFITVMIISLSGDTEIELSDIYLIQLVLFILLTDYRCYIKERCMDISSEFIKKYPRRQPFDPGSDLLVMHCIVNGFFAYALFTVDNGIM